MKKKVNFKCILTTILVSFLCFGLVGVINNKPKNTLDNVSKCIKENIIIKTRFRNNLSWQGNRFKINFSK